MKNINYYKRAFQNFGIFLIFASVLGILLLPNYSAFRENVRQNTTEKYNKIIHQEIKMMENEINLQLNTVKTITAGQDFKILSNPTAYGYTLNETDWHKNRENVRQDFSVLKSIVSLQDRAFMLFRNSDTQIDTNGSSDDFHASYDTLWRLTVNGERCPLDAATTQLFSKKHSGHFDGNIGYYDIASGNEYELVYLMTLSALDEQSENDSVFIACYDGENIIERMNFNGDISSVLITTDEDKSIYSFGEELDVSMYDSFFESDNLNIKIYYNVSKECIDSQMESINFFLLMVIIFMIVFGLIITLGVTGVEVRHIRRFVTMTDGLTDIKFSDDDDQYKYLEVIFENINQRNIQSADVVEDLTFIKMLNFRLSETEIEAISEYFVSSVCILVLKNTQTKYMGMERDVNFYLRGSNQKCFHTIKISSSESIFFIKHNDKIVDLLKDLIVYLNKERHGDVRGLYAVTDSINNVAYIYEKMKKAVNYIEYGRLRCIKDSDNIINVNDFKGIISKSRKLYEIIRSGNEFEAKRIVYEQWYKITQEEINSENTELLFFSQVSVLSQIIGENAIKVAVPKFNNEKDVVSIAFEITECIDQICLMINGNNGKKEDVRASQIIEYINKRYIDSSFYMPELVGKFELSDRAIVQMLKKSTGDNFSNYLGKLRIEKAREILENTNTPVLKVAAASGFDSSNSLYKAFKKAYGVSPSTYRANRNEIK